MEGPGQRLPTGPDLAQPGSLLSQSSLGDSHATHVSSALHLPWRARDNAGTAELWAWPPPCADAQIPLAAGLTLQGWSGSTQGSPGV